jgi:hypothetical protein
MSPFALPPLPLPFACARINSTDCTNMPEEPQHGRQARNPGCHP